MNNYNIVLVSIKDKIFVLKDCQIKAQGKHTDFLDVHEECEKNWGTTK